jgi:DNA-binding transcriptional MerR regulator
MIKSAEAARILGMCPSNLTRWNKSGIFLPAGIDHNGYRLYTKEQVYELKQKMNDKKLKILRKNERKLAREKAISAKYWENHQKEKERRAEIARINQEVWRNKMYDYYHVGKYNDNDELVAIFSNRNQAVIEFFPDAKEYLSWNGAMQQRMLRGGKFQGFTYKYIEKHRSQFQEVSLTPDQNKLKLTPIIVVDTKGEEQEYTKMVDSALENDLDYSTLYAYLLDSGRLYRNRLAFYRKGITKEFRSKHEAIAFYRIGKDKFKKLYDNNLPIRGQRVIIKNG